MAAGIGENEATIDRLGTPVFVPAGVPAGTRVIARMVAAVGAALPGWRRDAGGGPTPPGASSSAGPSRPGSPGA
jgi:hypothetical protein